MAEAALDLAEKEQGLNLDAMEAQNLLAQGKRNLLCGEVPKAVNQLQEACRLLAGKFGDVATECGEVYFVYGKALLELARMESGVLGNALEGVEEEDEKEEKASEDGKPDDRIEKDNLTEPSSTSDDKAADKTETSSAEGTSAEGEKAEGEEKAAEGEGAEDEEGDEGTEEEEAEGTEESEGDTEEEEGKEGCADKKEEEDVSNLQLAWEMFELAKIIYTRGSSDECKLKLADVFLKLGEVGLETEQYETAIADFKACLKLQQELLPAEDRALAETFYQLGLALAFNAQYDDSIENYRAAASSIQAKIAKLKETIEAGEKEGKGKETANADCPIVKAHKELRDLEDIIPDIMAKIEDVLDEKRSAETVKKMVKENVVADLGQGDSTTGFTDTAQKSSVAPMDITHLVRKKRKPEEDVEDSAKKAKTEEGNTELNGTANGTATENGVHNGNGTQEEKSAEVTAS